MQPVELFMGSPQAIAAAGRSRSTARVEMTPEQQAVQKAAAEELRQWRRSAPMSKVAEFRKLYDDGGVAIEIVKVDGIFGFTDDVLDYTFGLAKRLGSSDFDRDHRRRRRKSGPRSSSGSDCSPRSTR